MSHLKTNSCNRDAVLLQVKFPVLFLMAKWFIPLVSLYVHRIIYTLFLINRYLNSHMYLIRTCVPSIMFCLRHSIKDCSSWNPHVYILVFVTYKLNIGILLNFLDTLYFTPWTQMFKSRGNSGQSSKPV